MDSRVDPLVSAVGSGGSVDNKIETAIGKLDKADAPVSGQVVSAVSETDGIITVSRRALVEADIPTISQSKVNGLTTSLIVLMMHPQIKLQLWQMSVRPLVI